VFEWYFCDSNGNVASMDADGSFFWPRPIEWAPGDEIRIRFFKTERPDVDLIAWRHVQQQGRDGEPDVPKERPNFSLKRIRVGSKLIWEATLETTPQAPAMVVGDYYLEVLARWKLRVCGRYEREWHQKWMLFHLSFPTLPKPGLSSSLRVA